jgi:hypothetical protein
MLSAQRRIAIRRVHLSESLRNYRHARCAPSRGSPPRWGFISARQKFGNFSESRTPRLAGRVALRMLRAYPAFP